MARTNPRKVHALFHGGSSYGVPELDDFEVFGNIAAAREAFRDRFDGLDRSFPCVDEQAEMWLFFGPPAESDGYPDRILRVGPHGGVQMDCLV